LALIISYPTSVSEVIVLLKMPSKYEKLKEKRRKDVQKITLR